MRQQGNGAINEFNERVEIAAIRESLSLANGAPLVFGLVDMGVCLQTRGAVTLRTAGLC